MKGKYHRKGKGLMAGPGFSHLSPGDEGFVYLRDHLPQMTYGGEKQEGLWDNLVLYVIFACTIVFSTMGALVHHGNAMATECHAIFGVEIPNWRTADAYDSKRTAADERLRQLEAAARANPKKVPVLNRAKEVYEYAFDPERLRQPDDSPPTPPF
jgi:hypothetical protein